MSPAPAAFRDRARLNVDVHTKTDQKLTSSRQGILIKTSPRAPEGNAPPPPGEGSNTSASAASAGRSPKRKRPASTSTPASAEDGPPFVGEYEQALENPDEGFSELNDKCKRMVEVITRFANQNPVVQGRGFPCPANYDLSSVQEIKLPINPTSGVNDEILDFIRAIVTTRERFRKTTITEEDMQLYKRLKQTTITEEDMQLYRAQLKRVQSDIKDLGYTVKKATTLPPLRDCINVDYAIVFDAKTWAKNRQERQGKAAKQSKKEKAKGGP
jgi:hypothetical protein